MRCNAQNPCDRCRRKSIACEFTRSGYVDPYEVYEIGARSPGSTSAEGSTASDRASYSFPVPRQDPCTNLSLFSPTHVESQPVQQSENGLQNVYSHLTQTKFTNPTLLPSPQTSNSNPQPDHDIFDFFNFDALPMDFEFAPLFDWEPAVHFEPQAKTLPTQTIGADLATSIPRHDFRPSRAGFSLEQVDPVEAKCTVLRALLQHSEPLVTEDVISKCITRENLLVCTRLYGDHFQFNYPILHAPTFELVETPPILLLAIMLVGACWSDGLISEAHITKLSMRLLVLIQNQPHETNMQVPSLSTIQASIIICGVLVCSRNEIACKFVSVMFARNISMADRAGVFDAESPVDFDTMTEEEFDWKTWIEQELRRRIACEILCQDMAACVFQGKPPSFSPLSFNVELPCYEICWEAQTSSECFQQLQMLPRQPRVSSASRILRTPSMGNAPLFEASAIGMQTLMMCLHGFLSQTTQDDIEPTSYAAAAAAPFINSNSLFLQNHVEDINRLQQDLSGASVASLADSAVATYGSPAIKRLNAVLNAWRTTWELRRFREYDHENVAFKSDPLQFWWLSKLLLALHVHAAAVSDDSEFAIPKDIAHDERGKIALQTKMIGWMSRFRRHEKEAEMADETSVLPALMKPL